MLMATMMQPRESWTDERLDDLQGEVRSGFARVDADIRSLRGEMNARFEAANRNLIAVTVAIIAAVIGSNALF
jgi:ABC-type proline/glycine betaine transport system permease subunit